MALAFTNTKGKAISNKVDSFEFNKDGVHTCRMVGGILPRYMYWLKGSNGKPIPMECLSFDREKEKFTNIEVDHVPSFFPELKCSWAYSINCIDPKDGKVKVFNLKKKLFEQILGAAENLGDPTDLDTGWDIVFKRAKNGPNAFNVEYTLDAFKLKKRALTDDERAAVAAAKPIDELIKRQTADEQLASLNKITSGASDDADAGAEGKEEAADL
jgi:hypothetical protein